MADIDGVTGLHPEPGPSEETDEELTARFERRDSPVEGTAVPRTSQSGRRRDLLQETMAAACVDFVHSTVPISRPNFTGYRPTPTSTAIARAAATGESSWTEQNHRLVTGVQRRAFLDRCARWKSKVRSVV